MSFPRPESGVVHAATTPPAPSGTRLSCAGWLLLLLAASTPPAAHLRVPVESMRWKNSELGTVRPSTQPMITPPAPSLTAFDSTCVEPAGAAAADTPFAVHIGVPSKRTRRANTS